MGVTPRCIKCNNTLRLIKEQGFWRCDNCHPKKMYKYKKKSDRRIKKANK